MLPKSKTDQEGQGREVEIARGSQPENTPLAECTCPVRALDQWLRQAGIESGPVFCKVNRGENVQKTALNPASVAWIDKRALGRAGIRDLHRCGAHSLRAGFATTAFDNSVPEFKIRQPRACWRSTFGPNRRRDKKLPLASDSKTGWMYAHVYRSVVHKQCKERLPNCCERGGSEAAASLAPGPTPDLRRTMDRLYESWTGVGKPQYSEMNPNSFTVLLELS